MALTPPKLGDRFTVIESSKSRKKTSDQNIHAGLIGCVGSVVQYDPATNQVELFFDGLDKRVQNYWFKLDDEVLQPCVEPTPPTNIQPS